ncbi:ROK family transcriptional regulator [Paramicrobacterium fandaimingii]|uniref:ROK family transcriptional regulator n=1 Tax=Paramicrobacterium fandaimingii TaxID=2708079 RepID=UPI0014219580|nr:ROK family transcriptional regulator [Microbacterium fandaimingii]
MPPPPRRRGSSRGKILDLIRTTGPISRVELAEMTGLTQATISTSVRELLRDGLVSETGRGESTGGKPRTSLEINPAARLGIGLHIGRDYTTYIVADLAGTVVGRLRVAGVGDSEPESAITRMAEDIEQLLDGLDVDRGAIVGVGIATPGPLDRDAGAIMGAPALGAWTGFPLAATLSEATGFTCTFDNDATAAAIGEFWLGATGGYNTYASVYMGAGIGVGIVIDGTIYHGKQANVGELGHITVDAMGPTCACGNVGCVELYAGPQAVIDAAHEAVEHGELDMEFTGRITADFDRIADLALNGDATASAIFARSAEYLAAGIVSMVNLIDVQLVVLAGSAFQTIGSLYARTIAQRLGERAFARAVQTVDVRMSVNGTDAAALGAATLVLQDRLSPRSLASITLA